MHSWAACSAGLHWAQLALCPGAAQWRCLPHAPPYRGSPECHGGGEYQAMSPTERSASCRFAPTPELRLLGWFTQKELNGCQVPVVMTLPESLSNGMTLLEGGSTFLQVDLSQSTTREQESKALSLCGGLSSTPAASPTRAFSPKAEGQISMTMEVSKLLSWAVLDTSVLASGSSTPKRPGSLAMATLTTS